ncbi:hypothetical protein N2152v2_005936 [Parachlorella kessleri]
MQQLLLLDSAPKATSGESSGVQALIVHNQAAVVPVEARLELLRQDREAAMKTYDPLQHLPDGSDRQVELGYERVERGLTTNFVGNHMTQGAIDLVQAELEGPPCSEDLLLLEQSQQPARLLHRGPAGSSPLCCQQAPTAVPLQGYSWWDAGSCLRIRVDLARCRQQLRLPAGSQQPLAASCRWSRQSLRLQLSSQAQLGEDSGSPSPQGSPKRVPGSNIRVVELIQDPLCHAVCPAACKLEQAGPPALPAPPLQVQLEASNPTPPSEAHGASGVLQGSSSSGCSRPEAGAGSTAGAACQDPGTSCSAPLPAAAAEPQSGAVAVTVTGDAARSQEEACQGALALGPGATALLVVLVKEDASRVWDTLQAPAVVAAATPPRPPTNLATLRRYLRQQGQKAAPQPAPTTGSACATPTGSTEDPPAITSQPPATIAAETPPARAEPLGSGSAATLPGSPAWDSLLCSAQRSMQAGQYEAAIEACSKLLPHCCSSQLFPGFVAADKAPECQHAASGAAVPDSHLEATVLAEAAGDYTTALRLLSPGCCKPPAAPAPNSCHQAEEQEPKLAARRVVQLLLARAALYEQLEQYGTALDDLQKAAAWQHPSVDSQVALGIQRVSRSLRELQRMQQRAREGLSGSVQHPSVPRVSQLFSKPTALRA